MVFLEKAKGGIIPDVYAFIQHMCADGLTGGARFHVLFKIVLVVRAPFHTENTIISTSILVLVVAV